MINKIRDAIGNFLLTHPTGMKINSYIAGKLEDLKFTIENSYVINELDTLISSLEDKIRYNRLSDKIRYLHSYDNSETKDLIDDLTNNKTPTSMEIVKRKIKYGYKTIIFMLKP